MSVSYFWAVYASYFVSSMIAAPFFYPVARHTAERYSYSKILIGLAWLADLIGLPSGIGGIMTTLLMELPHSRQQEYEGGCLVLSVLGGAKTSPGALNCPTACS
jgi:hypothetical protein